MVKLCSKCDQLKDEEGFARNSRRKDGRQCWCRSCRKEYDQRRYYARDGKEKNRLLKQTKDFRRRNREFIVEYLQNHMCVDCEEKDIVVLQFDHVRGQKRKEVSTMVRACYSIESIKLEIAKCAVRCANCHLRRHAREGNWYTTVRD